MMSNPTCAVWYMRYGVAMYDLNETEEDAAWFAYHTEAQGDGSVLGVQFADGRLVAKREWQAYWDCVEQRDGADVSASTARPQMREAKDPFQGDSVEVPADDPSWLGA